MKSPRNPTGAFRKIQHGVQDGRRHIVKSRKLCKLVSFKSVFFCNIPFQLVLWSVSPRGPLLYCHIDLLVILAAILDFSKCSCRLLMDFYYVNLDTSGDVS